MSQTATIISAIGVINKVHTLAPITQIALLFQFVPKVIFYFFLTAWLLIKMYCYNFQFSKYNFHLKIKIWNVLCQNNPLKSCFWPAKDNEAI